MRQLYLDHHATTPVDPRVLDAMLPYLREEFGNASSKTHPFGWRALEAVEKARGQVAALLGASSREIFFTSGATESNNIALFGSAEARPARKDHIVTQATEHHAVLEPIEQLEKRGLRATILSPDPEGFVSAEKVREAITEETFLASVMAAQNEIGTLEPIAEIAAVCRERGVTFHTDAAQAAGKIPLDVERLGVDLLSISAHKFYGPKGVGALYARRRGRRARLRPVCLGGGQEGGIRPGTLNVPGIVGLGEACRVAAEELEREMARLAELRDRLYELVRAELPSVRLNGPQDFSRRLPGNLSLSFSRVDGTALLLELQDIGASAGSACSAGNAEPSYVLAAIGTPAPLAVSTLRLGLGRSTTREEVEHAARRIVETVRKLSRRGG